MLAHAVVVIAADHGEEFHEHGVVGHGLDLYNETLHVPLLLLAPGRPPAVADESVSLIDVAPTILDLIGAPAEPSFEGRSLVRPGAREPPYAELLVNALGKEPPQNRALIDGARKLMLTPAGGEQFYDLASDPGERNPEAFDDRVRAELVRLIDASRAARAARRRRRAGSVRSTTPRASACARSDTPTETTWRLRSLTRRGRSL